MTAIQYLSSFRLYGWDVLLLAGVVTLLTTLLKKTVFEGAPKKLFVFLPFAIGLVLFAVYRAIVTLSAEPFTTDFAHTLEGGFACGCAATLYYVIYEQFFRNVISEDGTIDDADLPSGETPQGNISPVAPLLEGYVPEETRFAVADALYAGAAGKTGDELRSFVRETLVSASPAATDAELAALTELIASYLASLLAQQ